MKYASISEKGVRPRNEDSCYIPAADETPLVIVADGMGGHAAGDTASAMAVAVIRDAFADAGNCCRDGIAGAVEEANTAIFLRSRREPALAGMGTTLVFALLSPPGVLAANVGDSRIYLFSRGTLRQISEDHSLVAALVAMGEITREEAMVHPRRNIITRALGTKDEERADVFDFPWNKGDTLLLCTDGLHGTLSDGEIAAVLSGENDIERAARKLVSAALDAGSADNVTVVLVRNEG